MEDILIGRKTRTSFRAVTLGAAADVMVPRNRHRIALIIGDPSAGAVTFSMDPNVAANQGLTQHSGNTPILLDIQRFGNLVTEELFGISPGGPTTIGIVEVSLYGSD